MSEIQESTNGAEKSIMSVCGGFGRVVVGVLLKGEDLLTGIEYLCVEHGIQYGVVLSIGSATHTGVHYLKVDDMAESGAARINSEEDGPHDFTNITGIIMRQESTGSFTTHLHGTFCRADGTLGGGHLHKGKNIAMSNFGVVILETKGIEMLNVLDPVTGFYHLEPRTIRKSKDE